LKKIAASLCLAAALYGQPAEYTLGNGFTLSDALKIGAYFSTEYEIGDDERSFKIDDIAILAYGELYPTLTYLAELEAVNFYSHNFENEIEEHNTEFHIERLYLDYRHSDLVGVRAGKLITPIGYWNLEPINVLRDTTSNPYYAQNMFPRFVSGVDVSGYLPTFDSTTYHLFAQKNRDLDEEYINIANEHFFGLSIDHELSMDWMVGGSVGQFVTQSDDQYDFIQMHIKYDGYPFTIRAEGILRFCDYDDSRTEYSGAAYVQGLYRYAPEHAIVSRYEYYSDDGLDVEDNVFLLGYSYRPIFPVSLKAEYQWHSLSHENRLLTSFSVLF